MFLCPRCSAVFSDAWGAGKCRDRDDADRWSRLARRYDRPVLLTEIGLPSRSVEVDTEHGEWLAAQVDRGTRSADVHGLWLYQLRDAGPVTAPDYKTNAELRFGLLTRDDAHPAGGVEKSYAPAVRAMIRAVST